jgi:hypothetical protein
MSYLFLSVAAGRAHGNDMVGTGPARLVAFSRLLSEAFGDRWL